MTINLYNELIRCADSREGEYNRRLIGYALRLCGAYGGADIDAVFAAAAMRLKSADHITGVLSQAEWTDERIALTLDCVRMLEEFSTGVMTPPAGISEEETADIHRAVEKGGGRRDEKVNTTREHITSGETGILTSRFSTVSTDFSTGRNDTYDENVRPEEPAALETKIILDAAALCECGAYAEAEKINLLGGRGSLSITDHALEAAQSVNAEPRFFTRQAKRIYAELEKNAREYDSILARECRALDGQLTRYEAGKVTDEPIYYRLGLLPRENCFEREGYFVEGGSVVRSRDRYYLTAAEWREHLGREGYIAGSEIICAVSDSPSGPFRYMNRLVSMRRRGFWDSQMSAEPSVVKIRDLKGELFLMFYTGAPCAEPDMRKIGAASSRKPEGPYMRLDQPLDLGFDVCWSPAPMQDSDGSIVLAFLHDGGKIAVARCSRRGGEYALLTGDAAPGAKPGPLFLCRLDGKYCLIFSDGSGSVCGWQGHGAALVSDDAVNWRAAPYPRVYDLTLMRADMSVTAADSRVRPFLTFEDGAARYLYTTAETGGRTFLTAQEINER
ncbi:MAG: hypothetical protein K6D94_10210 [Clostridiales bacterium]|nr:hypothetical protein [Clostridiales bacterium]